MLLVANIISGCATGTGEVMNESVSHQTQSIPRDARASKSIQLSKQFLTYLPWWISPDISPLVVPVCASRALVTGHWFLPRCKSTACLPGHLCNPARACGISNISRYHSCVKATWILEKGSFHNLQCAAAVPPLHRSPVDLGAGSWWSEGSVTQLCLPDRINSTPYGRRINTITCAHVHHMCRSTPSHVQCEASAPIGCHLAPRRVVAELLLLWQDISMCTAHSVNT